MLRHDVANGDPGEDGALERIGIASLRCPFQENADEQQDETAPIFADDGEDAESDEEIGKADPDPGSNESGLAQLAGVVPQDGPQNPAPVERVAGNHIEEDHDEIGHGEPETDDPGWSQMGGGEEQ